MRNEKHGDFINCDSNRREVLHQKGDALGYHTSKWGPTDMASWLQSQLKIIPTKENLYSASMGNSWGIHVSRPVLLHDLLEARPIEINVSKNSLANQHFARWKITHFG